MIHVRIEVCVCVLGMCVVYTWKTMCVYGVWIGMHMWYGVQHTWDSYVLVCIYIYIMFGGIKGVCENCVYMHL